MQGAPRAGLDALEKGNLPTTSWWAKNHYLCFNHGDRKALKLSSCSWDKYITWFISFALKATLLASFPLLVGILFVYIYCLLPSVLSNYKWTVSWSHSLALPASRPCLKCSTSHATSLFPCFNGPRTVVTAPSRVRMSAIQLLATRWSSSHVATTDRYAFSRRISVSPISLFGNIPQRKIYVTNNHSYRIISYIIYFHSVDPYKIHLDKEILIFA